MLSNYNPAILFALCLCLLLTGVIIGIVFLVNAIIFSKKDGNKARLKYTLISILCVIIAIISWFFNFGWLRLIMTFIPIPVIHAIVFLVANGFAASYVDKSARLKIYAVLSYITYLVAYLLLPDGGDIGPSYVFFGLIHHDAVADICYTLSSLSFFASIVIFILQIIERIMAKRKTNVDTEATL